jgi:cytidylate kinase
MPAEKVSTRRTIIAIDGPSGSGKSTLARMLANELGLYFLNTGLTFRGLAYLLVERAGYTENDLAVPRMHDIALYANVERFKYNEEGEIFFEGKNITPYLKSSALDKAASVVSTNQQVREALLTIQRTCAEHFDVVAEGRDIGTVVFPRAPYKFFLTASLPERARRWQADQARRGHLVTLDEAVVQLSDRDRRDSERAVAPLIKAVDAIEIDTTALSLADVLDMIKQHIKQ